MRASTKRAFWLGIGLSLCGCGDDGGSGSGSGSDGGSDDVPCVFVCNVAADCCPRPWAGQSGPPPNPLCPGAYPNNWSCVNGKCVNGCSNNADCAVPGYECHPKDEVWFCLEPCSVHTDCDENNEDKPGNKTFCTGVADDDQKYCLPG